MNLASIGSAYCPSNFANLHVTTQDTADEILTSSTHISDLVKAMKVRHTTTKECADVLAHIYLKSISSSIKFREKVADLMDYLFHDELFAVFFNLYPFPFIYLVCECKNEEEIKNTFDYITHQFPNWDKDLIDGFILLWEDKDVEKEKRHIYIQKILRALPESIKEPFLLNLGYAALRSNPACLVFLLEDVDEENLYKFFRDCRSYYQSHPFNQVLGPLIEAAVNHEELTVKQVAILDELIKICANNGEEIDETVETDLEMEEPEENSFSILVENFLFFNKPSQIKLLQYLYPEQQRMILKYYQSDMPLLVEWLYELFCLAKSIETQQSIIQFFSRFIKFKFLDFMTNINQDKYSDLLPSLMIELPNRRLMDFLFLEKAEVDQDIKMKIIQTRTDIFNRIKLTPDNRDIVEGLRESDYAEDYANTFIITPETELGYSNFSVIKDHIMQIHEIGDLGEPEINLINSIPLFLLAVVLFEPDNRAAFLKLYRYLNEEQLRIVIDSFPPQFVFDELEEVFSCLDRFQILTVFQYLSPSQMESYMRNKISELRNLNRQLSSKIKEIEEYLFMIQGYRSKMNGAQFDRDKFSKYFQECQQVSALLRGIINDPVCSALVAIENQLELELQIKWYGDLTFLLNEFNLKFDKVVGHFNRKTKVVEKTQQALSYQYTSLQELLSKEEKDEEDITILIYPEFWELLKQDCLVHLNLEHGGQLAEFGITSSEDLACLGISKNMQQVLDSLEKKIQSFTSRKNDFLNHYKQFLKASSDRENPLLAATLATLNIEKKEIKEVKNFWISFYGLLELLLIDNKHEISRVKKLKKELNGESENKSFPDYIQQIQIGIRLLKEIKRWKLTEEQKNIYRKLKKKLSDFAHNEAQYHSYWKNLIHPSIEYSSNDYKNYQTKILKLMEFDRLDPNQLKQSLVELYKLMGSFSHLFSYQAQAWEATLHELGRQDVIKQAYEMIEYSINLVKGWNSISLLKKYFQQPTIHTCQCGKPCNCGLRSIWKTLNENGNQEGYRATLNQLIHREIITFEEVYNLQNVANELDKAEKKSPKRRRM